MDEKLDVEIVESLSRLEAGELESSQRSHLEARLARTPAARRAIARLSVLSELVNAQPDPSLSDVVRRRVGASVMAALERQRRRTWLGAISAAAGVILVVTLLLAYRAASRSPQLSIESEVHTGPGEHQLLTIGDRATAFIGENSWVEAQPGKTLRIISGRVRFVVKPDKAHPWTVSTAAVDATVHGTEFDVDVTGDATEVRVARGEVEVHNALGTRTLWDGEAARTTLGVSPRREEHIELIALDVVPTAKRSSSYR